MEDRLIEMLNGESFEDLEFAFELAQSKVVDLDFQSFINKLMVSKKWTTINKYGFDCLERKMFPSDNSQSTSYSFLIDRTKLGEFKTKLKELGKI